MGARTTTSSIGKHLIAGIAFGDSPKKHPRTKLMTLPVCTFQCLRGQVILLILPLCYVLYVVSLCPRILHR